MLKLFRITGFMPYLAIMFLNASVDLAHKITIQNVLLKSFEGDTQTILTALVNTMILLPFIFLFSPSAFLNEKFVTQVLGLEISSKEGFLIYADVKMKFSKLCKFVKEKLGLENLRAVYHQALYAKENGLNLIDINHYESERYFSDFLAKYLQNLKIEVIISNSKNPFTYC